MSEFEELRDGGCLGRQCLTLIDKLIREEVRRFPALTPVGGWKPVDREDMLGKFLGDRLEKVTAKLLALATDDASVGRLLRKSIRNWLVDKARETDLGALRRVLETALSVDEAFERVPDGTVGAGRWRLVGNSGQPWAGRTEDLVGAARAVPNVRIPKWSSSTRRRPIASRASIVAVARAVLAAAEGSLEIGQLVHVFVTRFPVVLDPAVVPLSDLPEIVIGRENGQTPEEDVIAAEDELDAVVTAKEVVGMLSPEERGLVPHLDNPQAVQAELGCARSQAYHRAARLKEKLRQLVGDTEDVRAVGLEVIALCAATETT